MSDSFEYIEDYFEKRLNNEERQMFEERCSHDENFANDVAFYISAREATRQKLLEQKTQAWSTKVRNSNGSTSTRDVQLKKTGFKKWLPYAAACILLAIAAYYFYPSPAPHEIAHTYIQRNLTHLSQTMDGSRDSLQKGIGAYNNGNYNTALSLFQNVYTAHPDNSDAKEYIGLVYLMKGDYDKAIVHFDELAGRRLFSNPGLFLKAISLLGRDHEGDKEVAKKLLEQVRNQKLEGEKQAAEWLKKW